MPAVAVKPADAAPDATFTEAGTVSAVVLLESVKVPPPEPTGCDRVTVHADVPLELRLAGEHDRRLSTVGANSTTDAVWELVL